tara:strand:- start:143 stop:262 length:120 start_codon:yes stop_codon:yes gene_type:complete
MRFTYSDVKTLTKKDRLAFQKLYIKEVDREKEMLDNNKS